MVCPRLKPEIPIVVQVEVHYLIRYVVVIQGHLNELEGMEEGGSLSSIRLGH